MIIPDKILLEGKKLFEEYMKSDYEGDPLEYAMKHGSEALRKCYEQKIKEDEEARSKGIILN